MCCTQFSVPNLGAYPLAEPPSPYIPPSVRVPTMMSAQGKVVLGVVSVGTCNSPYCGRGCWFANSSRGCREGPDCKRCHNMDCALPADEERKANRKAKSRQRPSKKKRAKLALAYARATEKGERPVKPPMNRQYLAAMKRLETLRRSEIATPCALQSPTGSPQDYGAVYRDLLSECLLSEPPSSPSVFGTARYPSCSPNKGYLSPASSDASSFDGSTYSSCTTVDHIGREVSLDGLLGSPPSPVIPRSAASPVYPLPPAACVSIVNGANDMSVPLLGSFGYLSEDELELELLLQETLSAACQQV
ncbi:hypothetical protein FOZ61_009567 [Perkinsus olseni]|nr:hypothetical protein FOZ61_009567 [Perkinsus olseni]